MRIRTQIDFVGLCFLEPRFGEHIPEVVRTCYENPLVKEDRWAIVHEEGNEGGVLCEVHGWVAVARSFMEVPPSEVLGEAWGCRYKRCRVSSIESLSSVYTHVLSCNIKLDIL